MVPHAPETGRWSGETSSSGSIIRRRRLLRPFPLAALALAAAKNGDGRPGERGEQESLFDIGDLKREGDRENDDVLLVAKLSNVFISFGSRLA